MHLTPTEVATYTCESIFHIKHLIAMERLPHVRFASMRLIPFNEVKKMWPNANGPLPEFKEPLENYILLSDAADIIGTTVNHLRNQIGRGILKAATKGRSYITTQAWIEEYSPNPPGRPFGWRKERQTQDTE